jgi:hypothetical protein
MFEPRRVTTRVTTHARARLRSTTGGRPACTTGSSRPGRRLRVTRFTPPPGPARSESLQRAGRRRAPAPAPVASARNPRGSNVRSRGSGRGSLQTGMTPIPGTNRSVRRGVRRGPARPGTLTSRAPWRSSTTRRLSIGPGVVTRGAVLGVELELEVEMEAEAEVEMELELEVEVEVEGAVRGYTWTTAGSSNASACRSAKASGYQPATSSRRFTPREVSSSGSPGEESAAAAATRTCPRGRSRLHRAPCEPPRRPGSRRWRGVSRRESWRGHGGWRCRRCRGTRGGRQRRGTEGGSPHHHRLPLRHLLRRRLEESCRAPRRRRLLHRPE